MDQPMLPPTKRRRLQESAASLSKPFKSPLRKSAEHKLAAPSASIRTLSIAERNENATIGNAPEPFPKTNLSGSKQTPSTPSESNQSPIGDQKNVRSHPVSENAVSELQREHSSLLRQLSKLRQDLDTVEQAEKIESSRKDVELEYLINKWKVASRELAEQVFRTAKDRVNRMGGVDAWRERSRRPSNWEEDEEVSTADLSDEQREAIEIAREEMQHEAAKYGTRSPLQQESNEKNEVRDSIPHPLRGMVLLTLDYSPVIYNGYDA